MNQKGFINVLVIIGIGILVVVAGYFIFSRQSVNEINTFSSPTTLRVNEQAKFSDGLVVTLVEINDSRCESGVVCVWAGELSPRFMLLGGNISEFKEIRLGTMTTGSATQDGYTITLEKATENTATITVTKAGEQAAGDQIILREGQREGPLLVEKIYSNYLTGLVYREYPIAIDQGSPITLQIGGLVSNGCTITLTLVTIENKTAVFIKKTDYNRPCPICLAEGTFIDTPFGKIAVQDLKIGDKVWTKDLAGNRIAAPILTVSKTPVPLTHTVIHLKLEDGRELFVSPGHPVGDGRFIENLLRGDILDGNVIMEIERVAYRKDSTFDILPSGETGFYWANGILLDSTLH